MEEQIEQVRGLLDAVIRRGCVDRLDVSEAVRNYAQAIEALTKAEHVVDVTNQVREALAAVSFELENLK